VLAILLQAGLMFAVVMLSQAGTTVAAAYDYMVAMAVLTNTIPYVLMFIAYLRCTRLAPVAGAWTPPGGARTSAVLAVVGMISSIIAIGCTLAPNSGDPHPLAGLLKIVIATTVILVVGAVFYWLAVARRRAAAVAT